jgi:hypothetical protein
VGPFGPWNPDLEAFNSGGIAEASPKVVRKKVASTAPVSKERTIQALVEQYANVESKVE